MASNKRLIAAGAGAVAAELDPLQNFETVTYTGNGGTQKITGYIRKGAAFNGSSSYIDLGNNSSNNGSLISVSCWFRTTNSTSQGIIWNNGGQDSQSTGLCLSVQSSGVLYFQANTTTTFVNDTGTTIVNDGDWHHVVANYNNGNFNVYLDGNSTPELTGTSSAFTTTANQNFLIGRLSRISSAPFDGGIDQFRIFNRELTTSEVTTLYGESNTSTTKSTTDIFDDGSGVALYELDEDAKESFFAEAAHFNGSSKKIDLGTENTAGLSLFDRTSFSVSLWMYTTSTTSTARILGEEDDGGSAIVIRGDDVVIDGRSDGASAALVLNMSTSNNTWHHVTLINNNGNYSLYLDGSLADSNNYGYNITHANASSVNPYGLALGYRKAKNDSYFSGYIDEVRIYSDVLSGTEVGYLADNDNSQIPTDNLLAYYKLNGDATDEQGTYDGFNVTTTYSAANGVYGGTPTNVNFLGMAFQPDLIWFKNRDQTDTHRLHDSIRGIGKYVSSNSTAAEVTISSGGPQSFDSNGFTTSGGGAYNATSEDYVAWCWKAAGAANTYNVLEGGTVTSDSTASGAGITAGTTTSGWEVSANRDAGFSIVKYTAGGTANVGHGLSQAPELIINKSLDGTLNWVIYSADVGTQNFGLFTTAAFSSNSGTWSAVDANTFTTNINTTSYSYINYCFHSVDGHQKVGSYTGNGTSTSSTQDIDVGFQPRFVMIKNTSSPSTNWVLIDSLRENGDKWLYANTSDAEYDDSNTYTELTSTGFTLTNSGSYVNANNDVYIYLAIA